MGGKKRQEKTEKRKVRRSMNKELGRAGIKPAKKTKAEKRLQEPPASILFVDNTKGGILAKRLSQEEKRLSGQLPTE